MYIFAYFHKKTFIQCALAVYAYRVMLVLLNHRSLLLKYLLFDNKPSKCKREASLYVEIRFSFFTGPLSKENGNVGNCRLKCGRMFVLLKLRGSIHGKCKKITESSL